MNINNFRYAGAKTKLLPIIMEYLNPLLEKYKEYVEPFVGGGSVLLEVARQYPNHQLYINDKDLWVSSYYKIISSNNIQQINDLSNLVDIKPTLDLFYSLREKNTNDPVEQAYRAIFYNRCSFSGIIGLAGPIGGKNQLSKYKIDCRYNSEKIKDKIWKCHFLLKNRTIVDNLDFSEYKYLTQTNYPTYNDPPYWLVGDQLYKEKMNKDNHKELYNILQNRNNWLLSYDNCKEIKELYSKNNIINLSARYCIRGRKHTWETKKEILISC